MKKAIKKAVNRLFNRRSQYDYFTVGYREVNDSLKRLTGGPLLTEIRLRRQEVAILEKYTDDSVKARVAGMRKALDEVNLAQILRNPS